MTLLEFARGPALQVSIAIMIAGLCWRLVGIWLLPGRRNRAESRHGAFGQAYDALRTLTMRMLPKPEFRQHSATGTLLGYALHLALFVILFGGSAHILLWDAAFGVSWPGLPKYAIGLAGGLGFSVLLVMFARRRLNPVLRLLSSFDDYLALLLTLLPILTGILLARGWTDYALMLALHILSVELLMICLPFGKLVHSVMVFISRTNLGVRFSRKGAAI